MKKAYLRTVGGRVYEIELSRGQGPRWLERRLKWGRSVVAKNTVSGEAEHVVVAHVEAFQIEEVR